MASKSWSPKSNPFSLTQEGVSITIASVHQGLLATQVAENKNKNKVVQDE